MRQGIWRRLLLGLALALLLLLIFQAWRHSGLLLLQLPMTLC